MSYVDLGTDGRLRLFTPYSHKEDAKRLPDAKWDTVARAWTYPCDQEHLEAIRVTFGNPPVHDEAARAVVNIEQERDRLERAKRGEFPIELDGMLKATLRDYQKIGASFLVAAKKGFLSDELGLGKSVQALAAAIYLKQQKKIAKCLIACPNTVKRSVWERQIREHTHEEVVLVEGDKADRIGQVAHWMQSDILFCVINYEALRDKDYRKIIQTDMVICDESVKIKGRKSQQTKAVKSIPAEYKVAISGFPVANKPDDLWSQFDWLRDEGVLGTYWNFSDRYYVMSKRKVGTSSFKELVGYKDLDHLKRRLSPYVLRRLKSDHLDLPPKTFETREVELTDEQRTLYDKIRTETTVFIASLTDEQLRLNVNQIIVKLLRLSQICDGFVSDVEWEKPLQLESPKLQELEAIVEEVLASGQSIVIWSKFIPFIDRMVACFRGRYGETAVIELSGRVKEKERADAIAAFQRKDATICVGQVQVGGLGVDLTAASVEVFVSKAMMSIADVEQCQDRLHRFGQTNPVTIISLIARKTIDEHWEKLIQEKRKLASQVFEMETMPIFERRDVLELLQ